MKYVGKTLRDSNVSFLLSVNRKFVVEKKCSEHSQDVPPAGVEVDCPWWMEQSSSNPFEHPVFPPNFKTLPFRQTTTGKKTCREYDGYTSILKIKTLQRKGLVFFLLCQKYGTQIKAAKCPHKLLLVRYYSPCGDIRSSLR